MFEYLFNPKYKDAKKRYDAAKSMKKKLNGIKNDINNDASSVNIINKRINYICEDFAKAILVPDIRSRVIVKLTALNEPNQFGDINLSTACSSIDSEVSVLNEQMRTAESDMNTVKSQLNGSW